MHCCHSGESRNPENYMQLDTGFRRHDDILFFQRSHNGSEAILTAPEGRHYSDGITCI
jgi:hypothetical protein